MFNVEDKISIITGAAAGIGASIAQTLLEESVKHVTILDINDEGGIAMQKELNEKYGSNKVNFIKCDITNEHELVNAFRTVTSEQGYIDIVINNAGIFNDKLYIKEIEVNFTAVVRSSAQAWDLMRIDEGGRGGTVINIASVAALTSIHVIPVYSATKSAVIKFSNSLGDDIHYSRTGVRVLTVCFGLTDTQLSRNYDKGFFDQNIDKSNFVPSDTFNWQTTKQAAQGLIEAFKKGKSGSVWIVASGKPAVDVTATYVQSTQLFNDIIYN